MSEKASEWVSGKARACVAIAFCFCSAVLAAPGTTTVASKTSTSPSAAATPSKGTPLSPELSGQPQQSIFVISSDPKEVKDPFFPKSTRVLALATPVKPSGITKPPVEAPKLVCNGLSGTPERPLAIINNQTFTTGEEADVRTPNGKLRIRCIQIRQDSVIIEVNGQRQELHLKGF